MYPVVATPLMTMMMVFCRHRNVMVRVATAHHLLSIVNIIGPDRALHEFPDKVLPVAARFLLDGSLEARYTSVTSRVTPDAHIDSLDEIYLNRNRTKN